MTDRRRIRHAILLKALVLVLGIAGQAASILRHSFMSGNHFLYYTNQTNLAIMLLMPVLILRELRALRGAPQAHPAWLHQLHFVLASAILLTFTGFSLLLLPMLSKDYLLSPSNLLVHNLVPLLACVDYVLFPASKERPRLWLGLLGPLAYALFASALALMGHRFHGSVAPYFFLDYEKNGWLGIGQGRLGVLWWGLLIGALQLGLAWLLLRLRRRPPTHC